MTWLRDVAAMAIAVTICFVLLELDARLTKRKS